MADSGGAGATADPSAAAAAAASASSAAGPRLFAFGLIADVQYSDIPDGTSFDGSETRHYRGTLLHARAAAADFAARGASTVVQLGDLVDGKTNPAAAVGMPDAEEPCEASLVACATALEALAGPYVTLHVRGNHDVYNFSITSLKRVLALPPSAAPFPAPDAYYYSSSPHPRWRFLVLDAYDVSLARPRGSPGFAAAQALLKAHNPNPCAWGEPDAPPGNFFTGLRGTPEARYVPFNGALGEAQLAWLRGELARARAAAQRVAVFCHVPFLPAARSLREGDCFSTLLFNSEEVLAALAPYAACGTVAAVFAGHNHAGSFGRDAAGVPHFTLPSPLLWPAGSHAVVEVYEGALRVHAAGECASLLGPALQGAAGGAQPLPQQQERCASADFALLPLAPPP